MTKYLVETYYTCTFKVIHHLNDINETELNRLSQECKKLSLNCKKGDLGLIDLKTVHHGVLPKNGERHLLWLYY